MNGCSHSVKHSMHDLAWRTQKMQESTQQVNEALLRHLAAISPPAAGQAPPPLQPPARPQAAQPSRPQAAPPLQPPARPPATHPRQPQQPPPAEMLRQAPQTPPATPQPKQQPRITSQGPAKPPLQNPSRTRAPPPPVTKPTTPPAAPAAQSQQTMPPPRKLLCPKPQTPAHKAQPRTAGRPTVDRHLHALFLGCDPTELQLALTVMH